MEPSAIERELDDLETRIERLRGLYEQYFMGLERLEPQIPRKDVERKIHLLRREQIRNTGLRFKFQMLIQRYNTMQQYWARITREIENGVYRRDVMRAAARFGAKDALTILGKKRARQYAALAEAQAQKRAEPHAAAAEEAEEEEVELDAADFIDESSEDELEGPPTSRDPTPPVHPPTPMIRGGLRWGPGKRAAPPASSSTAAEGADRSSVKRRVEELAAAMRTPSTQGGGARSPAGLDSDFDDAPPAGTPARFGELSLDFEVPAAAPPRPPRPLTAPRPAEKPPAPAAEGPRPVVNDGKTQRKPVLK